jgi:two-component system cell cycle response regulator DivK
MIEWHVLVVEDDPDGQEVVGLMLRHHRISSEMVFNAEDALVLLAQNQYNLAILDLSLPGMDGWKLLETIQHNPHTAHIPCVAITAFHSADVAVKAIQAGFLAYFPKPLEATSFVRELEHLVSA